MPWITARDDAVERFSRDMSAPSDRFTRASDFVAAAACVSVRRQSQKITGVENGRLDKKGENEKSRGKEGDININITRDDATRQDGQSGEWGNRATAIPALSRVVKRGGKRSNVTEN